MSKPLQLLLLLLFVSPVPASEFHVAPDGSPRGDGSVSRPWDLQTALANTRRVSPGDTIILHAGLYRGGFTSSVKGAADAPVVVRPERGARVTIDSKPRDEKDSGAFTVDGEHSIFRDMEFTCSEEKRLTDATGSFPADVRRGGVTINGSHVKFINCVVHDLSNGFGFWSGGEGGEIYGCVIYNNGWAAPDRGHGHGIYAQNKTGAKRIVDNVIFHQFSHGIHAYGSSRAFINGFHVEGNIAFNNGLPAGADKLAPNILIGGGSPSERITVLGNCTFSAGSRGVVRLGYGADNNDLLLRGNFFADRLELRKWRQITARDNTVAGRQTLLSAEMIEGDDFSNDSFNRNHFFQLEEHPAAFSVVQKNSPQWTGGFEQWRRHTGLDADSTFIPSRPTGTYVKTRPNHYQPGRAHVAVYNFDRKDSVELDLRPLLKPGQRFRIVRATDFFGEPAAAGAFDSKPVPLSMKPAKVAPPVGMPDAMLPPSEPDFAAFVLLPAD